MNSIMLPGISRVSVDNLHLHVQNTSMQPQTKLTREVLLFLPHLSLSFSKLAALHRNGLLMERIVRRNTELMNLFFFTQTQTMKPLYVGFHLISGNGEICEGD